MFALKYGYTEDYVLKQIELFGLDWVSKAYEYVKERDAEELTWHLNLMPLARTPQSKEGARALDKYQKQIMRVIESITPWKRPVGSGRRPTDNKERVIIQGQISQEAQAFFTGTGVEIQKQDE